MKSEHRLRNIPRMAKSNQAIKDRFHEISWGHDICRSWKENSNEL